MNDEIARARADMNAALRRLEDSRRALQTQAARILDHEPERRRVLVVEDEPGLAAAMARVVSRMGVEVDLAENGTDALTFLQTCRYALVITDLLLPGGPSGFDVLDALTPQTPALIVSGEFQPEILSELAERVGRLEQMHKPFDILELEERVRRLLGAPHGT